MMKRIERNRKTIFVVGEKMEQTEQMCERIMELYPKMRGDRCRGD